MGTLFFSSSVACKVSKAHSQCEMTRNRLLSARCCPGQMRRPAPKVKRSCESPLEPALGLPAHRSGWNLSGSGKISGSLWTAREFIIRPVSSGIVYFPQCTGPFAARGSDRGTDVIQRWLLVGSELCELCASNAKRHTHSWITWWTYGSLAASSSVGNRSGPTTRSISESISPCHDYEKKGRRSLTFLGLSLCFWVKTHGGDPVDQG